MLITSGFRISSHKQWVDRVGDVHMMVTTGRAAIIFIAGNIITIHTDSYRIRMDKHGRVYYWKKTSISDERVMCMYAAMFADIWSFPNNEVVVRLPSLIFNKHFKINMYIKLDSIQHLNMNYGGLEL